MCNEKFITYLVINKINGKCYIGSHIIKKKKDTYLGSGKIILKSIKKYGRENFLRIDLKNYNNILDARKSEEYYINIFHTIEPFGYNISPTGGMGHNNFGRHSESSKKKQSVSQKKRFENPEQREKTRNRFKGKSYIELYGEIDGKILKEKRKSTLEKHNPHKGKYGKNNIHFGTKHSEKTKNKISTSNKNKPKSELHKKHLSEAWKKRKIEKPYTEETLQKMKISMIGKNVGKYIKIYEFKGPDGIIYRTNEGLVKFSKNKHIHANSFRELVKGIITEYHGWTYVQTIKG